MIDRTLHSANLLVAMAGLVSAPGIVAAIGSAVSGALSARDLAKSLPKEARPLVEEIHALLTEALNKSHLSESACALIPQMLELSVPDADTIIVAGKDPARILDAMEATLDQKGDPAHAPALLRQCFRDALTQALQRLMKDGAIAEALQAAFQTQALALLHAQNARLETLIAQTGDKARELHLTEQLFIGLARRVSLRIDNIDDAHRELEVAVDRAAEMDRQAKLPSNLGAQVDAVFAEVARRNAVDDLDGAADVIANALAEADAHKSRLLSLAINQSLLQLDAEAAAHHLIARADLEAGGQKDFEGLLELPEQWSAQGCETGSRLSLEVAVALARQILDRASAREERAAALNDLGIALDELGQQSGNNESLLESIASHRSAIVEYDRTQLPLQWAAAKNNIGNPLKTLGERTGDVSLLSEAVEVYREALEERTRERCPRDWAGTQNNLGAALQVLSERTGETALLEEAIFVYRSALEVFTRDAGPLDWATNQNNLGTVLAILGNHTKQTKLLREAVDAFEAALQERTRDQVPLYWAMTKNNLGNVLSDLGESLGDIALLISATEAFESAMEVRTRETLPLNWAFTQLNLADLGRAWFDLTQDADHLDAAQANLDSARQVFVAHGTDGYLSVANNIQAMIDARRA